MSNKQQTAVEWFANEVLYYKNPTNINGTDYILIPINKIEHLKEQAKEMEKEQIKGAWNHGFDWGMMEQSLAEQGEQSTLIDANYYYNETYGGN